MHNIFLVFVFAVIQNQCQNIPRYHCQNLDVAPGILNGRLFIVISGDGHTAEFITLHASWQRSVL